MQRYMDPLLRNNACSDICIHNILQYSFGGFQDLPEPTHCPQGKSLGFSSVLGNLPREQILQLRLEVTSQLVFYGA